MKKGIHPEYFVAVVHCAGCGASFTTGSTIPELRVSICSSCHPFYTGKQKMVDTEGRVDRFKRKYANSLIKGGAKGKSSGETTEAKA